MSRVSYDLTNPAKEDLKQIYKYTFQTWGENQAENYLGKLHAAFARLMTNPDKGKKRPEISKTLQFYKAEHHIIVYQIHNTKIEVIRVLHERMDISAHLD